MKLTLPKRAFTVVGIFLILVGALVTINNFQGLTGFVVFNDSSISGFSWFVGLFLVIAGIVVLIVQRGMSSRRKDLGSIVSDKEEGIVGLEEFADMFSSKEPNDKKRFIVLDTSAILSYSPGEVESLLRRYEGVFVPDSVLAEIKNPKTRRIVEEHSQNLEGYEGFKKMAHKTLEQTEKPRLREFLLPYLTGEKKPQTNRELTKIQSKTSRVREIMRKEGIDLDTAKSNQTYVFGKIREYLDRHCKVSEADTDVLAMGLCGARHRNHALIGEKDIDFRQAVADIKKSHPKIGNYLDCIEPYAQAG